MSTKNYKCISGIYYIRYFVAWEFSINEASKPAVPFDDKAGKEWFANVKHYDFKLYAIQ